MLSHLRRGQPHHHQEFDGYVRNILINRFFFLISAVEIQCLYVRRTVMSIIGNHQVNDVLFFD